jgi:N-acetylated-alpha-linked acidic dipeptidase
VKSLRAGLFLFFIAGGALSALWSRPGTELRGFLPASAAMEMDIEKAFRAVPTPERARLDLWTLTAEPHIAGTPEDLKTAHFVLEQFRATGLDAEIVEYHVLLPMPKKVEVDLVEPFKRPGPTPEGNLTPDEDAAATLVPAFNAYSPSGDVTAPVVYANYGLPEDFEQLKSLGVDVAGKIVLVRYGRCFRGVKVYVAEQKRAAGVLIYSDPADDGFRQGDAYPRGPWRPSTGVQRGSILYMTDFVGDPLTPGVAATKHAPRLSRKEQAILPRVPTAPLSSEDASPILENLTGPVAPREWQGALPLTYHVGPGAAKVHLKLDMDFRTRPIWNVIARIPGAAEPDRRVVLGNHRDAWTYGAVDPASGTAPLLAVARGLGQLMRQGWRPRRTLILASWDAEEYGLIGSTEWVEEHAGELARHAVAYLNIDSGVSGSRFVAAAVPSLGRLIREVTEDVTDPGTGRSVYAVWSEESGRVRREGGLPYAVLNGSLPPGPDGGPVGDLGSGSDYTPFLQHVGVPSLDISFGGAYGVYHSIYDNFEWMQRFGDPTFRYSVAVAQIFGTLALRLANADFLPFDYEDYGRALEKYLGELETEMKKSGGGNSLQWAEAKSAATRFKLTARLLAARIASLEAGGGVDPGRLNATNQALLEVERAFLLADGLPGRAWFRHAFYAPGVYTGYSAVVFPGVREAAARQDWKAAAEQFRAVSAAINRGTEVLTRAVGALQGSVVGADY